MTGTNEDLTSNEDLTPIEEQAIDALLSEAIGNAAAPDLSREIFEQLRVTPSHAGAIAKGDRAPKRAGRSPINKQVVAVVTVVAVLAASLLFVTWLRSDHDLEAPMLADDSSDLDWPNYDFPMADATGTEADTSPTDPGRASSRGIPLVVDSPTTDRPLPVQNDVETPVRPPQQPLQAVTLVSNQVDAQLHNYWNAIGIEPSADAGVDAIAARLSMALGFQLPTESVDDPQQLEAEFVKTRVARAIARRWLLQISDSGLSRVDEQSRNGLVNDLARCFQSKQQFDQTLARWIGGQGPNTAGFYSVVSSGSKNFPRSGMMVRRVAALTMNVDLRCTRCHDSQIEGNGRQKDYWAFAEFLRHGLTRDADRPLFYDLPDGRRRIAEPAVATTWMKSHSGQPVSSVGEWSQSLIGSPELARGVVNSLWQLVHGQPLRGRVVDPISAPHNGSLDLLEENLAQDLVRSQFNVARTLALIVASPATQRAVPTPLLPENALLADESETRRAMHAVNAFAAALPSRTQLATSARLKEAMRAIGNNLDADGRPFVAQIGNAPEKSGNTKDPSKSLSMDFPYRADSLPVQWLSSIKDEQSQVEHLGYLAGVDQVPSRVLEAAESMRAASVDNELTLHRIWWLMRP